MKKKLLFSIAVILITAMTFGASLAFAQTPPGPATAWPWLYNPTTTNATATIDFYNLSGDKVFTVNNFSVPAGQTVLVPVWTYNQAPPNGLGSSFTGSMVVSSDVQLVAMCNVVSSDSSGGSYSGASTGATSVRLPSVHKNNWGWYSEISVQNVDSTDATVQVAFTPGSGSPGTAYTTPVVTIKPGAAYRWNTATIAGIGTEFLGSAVATSTNGKNIIATCEEWNTSATHMTLLYNGISGSGGTTLYLPAQHNNNYGWFAYNYIFNTTGDTANVHYEWVGSTVSGDTTIPPNGMLQLFTGNYMGWAPGGTNYVGALKVTCTNGKTLVGMCNEVNINGYNAGSYNAFYEGYTTLFFPAQHNQDWGWQAFNFIYNTSTTTAANVRVTWTKTSGTGSVPAPFTTTINPNDRLPLFCHEYLTGNVVGSLKVECLTAGVKLVGVCNEIDTDAGSVDAFISYNGFGQ